MFSHFSSTTFHVIINISSNVPSHKPIRQTLLKVTISALKQQVVSKAEKAVAVEKALGEASRCCPPGSTKS